MSGKYDTVSKDLTDVNPADLLAVLGQARPSERVRSIDADLSSIVTSADKVIWVDDPQPWILHAEFHTYWDGELPFHLNVRNALLRKRHMISVASVVFLLRPLADATNLTGVHRNETPIGKPSDFHYEVVRMWTLAPETILNGPLSMLPYAPLCGVDESGIAAVVAQMKERITAEAAPPLAGKLWAATYVLMGLQFKEETIKQLLSGVQTMRESVTYQAILREGREEEARKLLIRAAKKRLGIPDAATLEKLNSICELSTLEDMVERVADVESWQQLLGLS